MPLPVTPTAISISPAWLGSYELKVFDKPLDVIIASLAFTVDEGGSTCDGGQPCDFGEVPVFNWFNRLQASVFNDTNQNGFWDNDETNISNDAAFINLRWRDGSIYQSFAVDTEGVAPFDEVFPFLHWLVTEVSFTNKKATGVTVVVDAGGPVDTSSDAFPGYGALNPQPQAEVNPNTGNNLSRTETGPVLTQGVQGFLGQTNVMEFGKADYKTFDFSSFPPIYVGENGGISGIVFSATTRAENDPRYAIGETWEPGIPRVQVALYADGDIDWTFPNDPCDIDWNGNGVFDYGDALAVFWTDSWDDNLPMNCPGQNQLPGQADNVCSDGLRNFNQVRPAVFDGRYAFNGYDLDHLPQSIRRPRRCLRFALATRISFRHS